MDLHGIVARSSQAFKYIFDPSVEIQTPAHASQLAELKRRLDDMQKKLDASARESREKDTLIAQLREKLAAQEQRSKPAPVKKAKATRQRKTTKKTNPVTKTPDKSEKPAQTRQQTKKAKPTKPGATAKKRAAKAKRKDAPRRRES